MNGDGHKLQAVAFAAIFALLSWTVFTVQSVSVKVAAISTDLTWIKGEVAVLDGAARTASEREWRAYRRAMSDRKADRKKTDAQ